MTDTNLHSASAKQRSPPHVVVHYWGVAILLVGLLAATLIFVFAGDDGRIEPGAEIVRGKMYQHDVQLIGGKAGVAFVRFDQWLSSLWHGRPLAYTIAVLTILVAAACFWVAWVMSMPLPSDEDRGTKDDGSVR
ncbi:MAG: hypothetical protein ABI316_02205 [Casimicrobiaceae bacterium]